MGSGPQQRGFSAGAQQVVRSSGVQQADSALVLSPGVGETAVVRATAARPSGSGGERWDKSVDMDVPWSRLGSTTNTVFIAVLKRDGLARRKTQVALVSSLRNERNTGDQRSKLLPCLNG